MSFWEELAELAAKTTKKGAKAFLPEELSEEELLKAIQPPFTEEAARTYKGLSPDMKEGIEGFLTPPMWEELKKLPAETRDHLAELAATSTEMAAKPFTDPQSVLKPPFSELREIQPPEVKTSMDVAAGKVAAPALGAAALLGALPATAGVVMQAGAAGAGSAYGDALAQLAEGRLNAEELAGSFAYPGALTLGVGGVAGLKNIGKSISNEVDEKAFSLDRWIGQEARIPGSKKGQILRVGPYELKFDGLWKIDNPTLVAEFGTNLPSMTVGEVAPRGFTPGTTIMGKDQAMKFIQAAAGDIHTPKWMKTIRDVIPKGEKGAVWIPGKEGKELAPHVTELAQEAKKFKTFEDWEKAYSGHRTIPGLKKNVLDRYDGLESWNDAIFGTTGIGKKGILANSTPVKTINTKLGGPVEIREIKMPLLNTGTEARMGIAVNKKGEIVGAVTDGFDQSTGRRFTGAIEVDELYSNSGVGTELTKLLGDVYPTLNTTKTPGRLAWAGLKTFLKSQGTTAEEFWKKVQSLDIPSSGSGPKELF